MKKVLTVLGVIFAPALILLSPFAMLRLNTGKDTIRANVEAIKFGSAPFGW